MKITLEPAGFRPVSILLESRDELDQLMAIVGAVAENQINHPPSSITAAKAIMRSLVAMDNHQPE